MASTTATGRKSVSRSGVSVPSNARRAPAKMKGRRGAAPCSAGLGRGSPTQRSQVRVEQQTRGRVLDFEELEEVFGVLGLIVDKGQRGSAAGRKLGQLAQRREERRRDFVFERQKQKHLQL